MAQWWTCEGRGFKSHPQLLNVYRRQLTVPSLQDRLKSWGVNGHTTRCNWPSLAALADVRLRANETEISAALRATDTPEGLNSVLPPHVRHQLTVKP